MSTRSLQMSFGGFAAQPPSDRLFFAVHPDARAAQRIVKLAHSLRAKHGLRGKPIPADRVHVTLHHLGDHAGLPDSLIAMASEAAARVSMSQFEVEFDRVASFSGNGGRKHPCVLRNDAKDANAPLFALHGESGALLRAAGLGRHLQRRFTPHVTLLYGERSVAVEPVEPIAWRVREFGLVHSLLGRSEHRVLGRWELSP